MNHSIIHSFIHSFIHPSIHSLNFKFFHLRMRQHRRSICTHRVAVFNDATIQLCILQAFFRIHAIAKPRRSFSLLSNRRIRVQIHLLLYPIPLFRTPSSSMAFCSLHRSEPRIQEVFVFFDGRRNLFASPQTQAVTLFLRSSLRLLFLASAVRTQPRLSFGNRRQVQAAQVVTARTAAVAEKQIASVAANVADFVLFPHGRRPTVRSRPAPRLECC